MDRSQRKFKIFIEDYAINGTRTFCDLSYKEQKKTVAAFLNDQDTAEKWEYIQAALDHLYDSFPDLIGEIMRNEEDRFDPASEMSDELAHALLNVCSDDIDCLFDEVVANVERERKAWSKCARTIPLTSLQQKSYKSCVNELMHLDI